MGAWKILVRLISSRNMDANSLPLDPSEKRQKPVELKQILALHEDVCVFHVH